MASHDEKWWATIEADYQWMADAYAGDEVVEEEELGPRLEQAAAEYNKGGLACRAGATMALRTTIGFLRSQFAPSQADRVLRPLAHLLSSLERLEVGVRDELLKSRESGGTRLRREEAAFRLLCVAQYQLLQLTMDRADEYVARRLQMLGFCQHRKDRARNTRPITAKTVRHWSRKGAAYLEEVLPSGVSLNAWLMRLLEAAYWAPITYTDKCIPENTRRPKECILDLILPRLFGHLRVS